MIFTLNRSAPYTLPLLQGCSLNNNTHTLKVQAQPLIITFPSHGYHIIFDRSVTCPINYVTCSKKNYVYQDFVSIPVFYHNVQWAGGTKYQNVPRIRNVILTEEGVHQFTHHLNVCGYDGDMNYEIHNNTQDNL